MKKEMCKNCAYFYPYYKRIKSNEYRKSFHGYCKKYKDAVEEINSCENFCDSKSK